MPWLDLEEDILEEFGSTVHVASKQCGVFRQNSVLRSAFDAGLMRVVTPIDRGKYRESHTRSMRKYRLRLELAGLCIVCAGAWAVSGSKKCVTCRSDTAKYNTARHHELKDAGRCASCGKSSDRQGKAYCSKCTAVRRDRWQKRYAASRKRLTCAGESSNMTA